MLRRTSLSKRVRFEIFKRDGFKCLYCGATPAQKVLRVDHVKPLAEGGGDEPTNLVTACFDCNSGKGAVPLEKGKYTPGFASEADKEHAEQIRAWLAVQREIEVARSEVADAIADLWEHNLGDSLSQEMFKRFPALSKEWTFQQLAAAMAITANKFGRWTYEYSPWEATSRAKYFQAILRNWRSEGPPPDLNKFLGRS